MKTPWRYSKGQNLRVIAGDHAGSTVQVVGQPKNGNGIYRCEVLSGSEDNYISVAESDLEEMAATAPAQEAAV